MITDGRISTLSETLLDRQNPAPCPAPPEYSNLRTVDTVFVAMWCDVVLSAVRKPLLPERMLDVAERPDTVDSARLTLFRPDRPSEPAIRVGLLNRENSEGGPVDA